MRAWLNTLPTMLLVRYAKMLGCTFTGALLTQRQTSINFLWQLSMSGNAPLTVATMQAMLTQQDQAVPAVFVMKGTVA